MKLKTFDNSSNVFRRDSPAAISINVTAGLFTINKKATEILQIEAGNKVVLHQDEDELGDWYIEKADQDAAGFEIRSKTKNGKPEGGGIYFNNTPTARAIFESVEYPYQSGRILLAGEPTEIGERKLYALLTDGLKNEE